MMATAAELEEERRKERKVALGNSVRGYVSAITQRHNEIEHECAQGGDLTKAQSALNSMKNTFQNYEVDVNKLMSLQKPNSVQFNELSEKLVLIQSKVSDSIRKVNDLALRNVSQAKSVTGSVKSRSSVGSRSSARAIANARLEGLKAKQRFLCSPEVKQKKLEAEKLVLQAQAKQKEVEELINIQADIKQAEAEVENLDEEGVEDGSPEDSPVESTRIDDQNQVKNAATGQAGGGGGILNTIKGFFITPKPSVNIVNNKGEMPVPSTILKNDSTSKEKTQISVHTKLNGSELNPFAECYVTTPCNPGAIKQKKLTFKSDVHPDELCRPEPMKTCPMCEKGVSVKCSVCPECNTDLMTHSVRPSALGHSAQDGTQQMSMLDTSALDPLLKLQNKMLDTLTLPKSTLTPYSGDPIAYHTFITRFDAIVGEKVVDGISKLDLLCQYCTGKAYDSIQGCVSIRPPEEGYKRAREILEDRYGDPYTITKAHIDRITKCPALKMHDSEALRSYADRMRTTYEIMSSMGMLSEVDNRDKIVEVVKKLPCNIRGKWQNRSQDYKEKHKKYPSFIDLVQFIEKYAKQENDPVHGSNLYSEQSPQRSHRGQRSVGTIMNTVTNQSSPGNSTGVGSSHSQLDPNYKCRVCAQNHTIIHCEKFKSMGAKERLAFIRDQRLCFNCMRSSSHLAHECRLQKICTIGNCNKDKLHHPMLHEAFNASGSHPESNGSDTLVAGRQESEP